MPKLVNRAKMTTATTGTGTITLGSAVEGYQTFAAAGVVNGDVVRYVIEDGTAWEIGLGTYSAGSLTRGSIESSNADAALNLSGNAVVFVSAAAADLQELVDFADNFVLPTADGTNGQVLTTNGSGTLSFTTITGYTNADVDAHLNTGTAASGEVLSWNGTDYDWIAAPAALTGQTDSASPFETSLGVGAGAVSTGVNNTFVGFEAGNDNTTGTNNTAIGFQTLGAATTGTGNVAIGADALGALTTSSNNVSLGRRALLAVTTNGGNVAIGDEACLNGNTFQRIGIGLQAARSAGNFSIGIGTQAGNSQNVYGIAIGELANSNGNGAGIAIGYRAGRFDGGAYSDSSVLIGHEAGASTSGTGTRKVALGAFANPGTSGANNIVIGHTAAVSTDGVSNEITLGNSSITTLRCQVTTITSLSDARDKTDIQPLNAGLEFVEALNPVSFNWAMRDGGKVGEADTGFIAQDLQAAQADTGVSIPGLVYDVNPDKLEAGYGKLIPVLVQAIKDLSAKVNLLEAQLEAQK